MSQDFHQGSSGVYGGFSSSDGFDRPDSGHHQDQHQHVAQQSRRDKLRVQQQQQGFVDPQLLPMDGGEVDHAAEPGAAAMYEHHAAAAAGAASNMLSEMFNFPPAPPPSGPSATELLASQMTAASYRFGGLRPGGLSGSDGAWFGGGRASGSLVLGGGASGMGSLGETSSPKQQGGMDPAAAMQLFLMNPQQQQQSRSSPASPPPSDAQSAIQQQHEAFQAFGGGGAQFGGGGVVEGQGLSLSLSPSLQQLEMAKQAEELRVRDGVLYFNRQQQQAQLPMALHGGAGPVGGLGAQAAQLHVGYGPAGVAGVLRNSKYTRAAQELLEEFCSVGRGQIKGGGGGRGARGASSSNPNNNKGASSSGAAQSAESKEPPALSPADRFEHQRKKAKLISMLDEARLTLFRKILS